MKAISGRVIRLEDQIAPAERELRYFPLVICRLLDRDGISKSTTYRSSPWVDGTLLEVIEYDSGSLEARFTDEEWEQWIQEQREARRRAMHP